MAGSATAPAAIFRKLRREPRMTPSDKFIDLPRALHGAARSAMRRMACPGALADPSCPEVLAPQTTHAERFTGVSRNLKRAALTRMDRAFDPAKGGRILLARAVHERHFL